MARISGKAKSSIVVKSRLNNIQNGKKIKNVQIINANRPTISQLKYNTAKARHPPYKETVNSQVTTEIQFFNQHDTHRG